MEPTCRRIIRSRCCLLIPWAAVRVQDSSLGASWPAEALSSTPARYRDVKALLWVDLGHQRPSTAHYTGQRYIHSLLWVEGASCGVLTMQKLVPVRTRSGLSVPAVDRKQPTMANLSQSPCLAPQDPRQDLLLAGTL